MTIFAVVILSPDSVLIRLVEDASPEVDSWTVLFWRGTLYAVGVSTLVFLKYRSKTISEFKNIGGQEATLRMRKHFDDIQTINTRVDSLISLANL